MNKQPETTEKTRQRFLDVFCELYTQKPIEKISVQEITRKAGYNRSTFYQYFFDIYDLLAYVENDVLEYIQRNRTKTVDISTHTPIEDILKMFKEKGTYLKALMGDYGNFRFLELIKKEFSIIAKSDNEITPYLLEFRISTVLTLFHQWERRGEDLPVEKMLGLIDDLYANGISSFL